MSKGTKTVTVKKETKAAKPAAAKAVKPAAEKKVAAKAAPKAAATKATEKKVAAKAAPAKKTVAKAAAKPAAEKKVAAKVSAAKPAAKKVAAPKASAKKTVAPKKVAVSLEANCPLATTVSVAGSFNNWMVDVDMLKKDKKSGLWKIKLELLPGEYEYKFVCDGQYWDAGANKVVKA